MSSFLRPWASTSLARFQGAPGRHLRTARRPGAPLPGANRERLALEADPKPGAGISQASERGGFYGLSGYPMACTMIMILVVIYGE